MKNKWFFFLFNGIFTIVGIGMLIGGFMAKPGSMTDDGTMALNKFFYMMGAIFIVFPALVAAAIMFFYKRSADRINYMKTQGIPGTARIVSFSQTGVRINYVPQLALELNITNSLGEQYTIRQKRCIDPIYYQTLRPDSDIPVLIDPKDKNNVYLDLEQAWANMAKQTSHPFNLNTNS